MDLSSYHSVCISRNQWVKNSRRALDSAAVIMVCLDDGPDFLSEEDVGLKAVIVDLQSDAALQVDILDALSERDKVKSTVHTKSSLPNFKQNEFSVIRQHEEFV